MVSLLGAVEVCVVWGICVSLVLAWRRGWWLLFCQVPVFKQVLDVLCPSVLPDQKAHTDLNCPICMDTVPSIDIRVLPCSHNFHKQCLDEWVKSLSTRRPCCPLCRRGFSVSASGVDAPLAVYRVPLLPTAVQFAIGKTVAHLRLYLRHTFFGHARTLWSLDVRHAKRLAYLVGLVCDVPLVVAFGIFSWPGTGTAMSLWWFGYVSWWVPLIIGYTCHVATLVGLLAVGLWVARCGIWTQKEIDLLVFDYNVRIARFSDIVPDEHGPLILDIGRGSCVPPEEYLRTLLRYAVEEYHAVSDEVMAKVIEPRTAVLHELADIERHIVRGAMAGAPQATMQAWASTKLKAANEKVGETNAAVNALTESASQMEDRCHQFIWHAKIPAVVSKACFEQEGLTIEGLPVFETAAAVAQDVSHLLQRCIRLCHPETFAMFNQGHQVGYNPIGPQLLARHGLVVGSDAGWGHRHRQQGGTGGDEEGWVVDEDDGGDHDNDDDDDGNWEDVD
eukprot:m.93049 g.93049  ORF g.93049 m.93049 type:complete len:503 (-) comp15084_c1_seq2:80-1588(-)